MDVHLPPPPLPLSRLNCACAFSDGAQRLTQLLDEVTLTATTAAKVGKLKAAVSVLRKLHEAHLAEYGPAYGRSLLELSKVQAFNPLDAVPLQITAHGAKELQAYREPPKKRTKKQETQERKKRKTRATAKGAPKKGGSSKRNKQ